jgi:hypothetical protein
MKISPFRFAFSLIAISAFLHGAPSRPNPPDVLVNPVDTDKAITSFNNPHGIYFPEGKPRNNLFLFLPGTNPKENQKPGARRLCRTAAELGYHVICLMYPNDVSAAEVCRNDTHPEAFSEFRRALIAGAETPYAKTPRTESIEYRTIKLLAFLANKYPSQHWDQYLTNGQLNWPKFAVGGQSQGGGHAAWIATRYTVARVLCFGSPKDYSHHFDAPATWYEKSATPRSRYFAFNNVYDMQGCTHKHLLANLKALGLTELGVADVDTESPPYHHARALFTSWPGHRVDSKDAHTSVVRDNVLDKEGEPVFLSVWRYMLTEPAENND